MDHSNLWGIDLGGTKIEGVILDSAANPKVLYRERIPTEADKGYEHMVDQIVKMLELMSSQAGYAPERIGIGTPGTLDPQLGVMKNCNTTALNGKPLKKDLEAAMGVKLDRDASRRGEGKVSSCAGCFWSDYGYRCWWGISCQWRNNKWVTGYWRRMGSQLFRRVWRTMLLW